MGFTTKLDFSSNRQVKQFPETSTALSGATIFGVPFSALTKGPDLTATAITGTFTGLISSFSGNATTSVYNWSNTKMQLGASNLVPITPSNTATTQNTLAFTSNTTTTIDGNLVTLTYSGVSFDITPSYFINLGGGNYSGTVFTNTLLLLNAGTLDFTGRTIWADVSGITRTRYLEVNNDATFTNIGSQSSFGTLHYTSGGTLTTNTSDKRLKTNITQITNALSKVLSLKGVYYNWADCPDGDKRIGFIAQDVNTVVPELVFVNKNSEQQYMGVHYENATSLLVEAIKELVSGTSVGITSISELTTQKVIAEDNFIELNFNGNHTSSIGGGIRVLKAINNSTDADLKTNESGAWITNNDFIPAGLIIPSYTPKSSDDIIGTLGSITRDDDFIYIKTKKGWRRSKLESF